ncbi:hypothetical protein D5F01_LYC15176 [Larimichthys crocea]|uniref:CCHC-type domain-containing protein n=1 Tax=Larimichthys crocea TaxID=215358 RepID=A0A6G0I769_LARCR|nr:hypothetical protein D5F01_LYC15176 [Larimichthys crocea]
MRQGRRSVMDYAIAFGTLAADSGWNQPALVDAFFNGHSERVKDSLTPLDLPSELDVLVSLASKIDKRLLEHDRTRNFPSSQLPGSYSSWGPSPRCTPAPALTHATNTRSDTEELMQIEHTRLSPEERLRRCNKGRCIYCAQMGHFLENCPIPRNGSSRQTSVLVCTSPSKNRPCHQFSHVTLFSESLSLPLTVVIDSGADASLIDKNLAKRLNLSFVPLDSPMPATALDGHVMYLVTHCTSPVTRTPNR